MTGFPEVYLVKVCFGEKWLCKPQAAGAFVQGDTEGDYRAMEN